MHFVRLLKCATYFDLCYIGCIDLIHLHQHIQQHIGNLSCHFAVLSWKLSELREPLDKICKRVIKQTKRAWHCRNNCHSWPHRYQYLWHYSAKKKSKRVTLSCRWRVGAQCLGLANVAVLRVSGVDWHEFIGRDVPRHWLVQLHGLGRLYCLDNTQPYCLDQVFACCATLVMYRRRRRRRRRWRWWWWWSLLVKIRGGGGGGGFLHFWWKLREEAMLSAQENSHRPVWFNWF